MRELLVLFLLPLHTNVRLGESPIYSLTHHVDTIGALVIQSLKPTGITKPLCQLAPHQHVQLCLDLPGCNLFLPPYSFGHTCDASMTNEKGYMQMHTRTLLPRTKPSCAHASLCSFTCPDWGYAWLLDPCDFSFNLIMNSVVLSSGFHRSKHLSICGCTPD